MAENTTHRPIMWSTLAEYEGDPDVLARQSPAEWNSKPKGFADALENLSLPEASVRRRTFLKMGGFAAVLAAVAGCEKPAEKILPYVTAPENITPGIANYYASTCRGCEAGCGIVVKTREARPIKLEGNPQHILNKGTLCTRGQGSLIGLYDPDRLPDPVEIKGGQETKTTWQIVDARIAEALKGKGSRAVLLTGTVHGVGRTALIDKFKETFPGLRHVVYDTLADGERIEANGIAYGEAILPRYHFGNSEVTVLLGADPMAESHSAVEHMAGIADQRRVHKGADGKATMGRLIAFEPVMSHSGMNADERHKVRPAELLDVALGLIAALNELDPAVKNVDAAGATPESVESKLGLKAGTIKKLAEELNAKRGKSLVYTGGAMARTPRALALHAAVNAINSMLENEGKTVDASRASNQARGTAAAIVGLIEDMKAGKVDTLLIEGVNPAYSLPKSAGFAEALKSVKTKVSFARVKDETAVLCDAILPDVHYLENWGDAEPIDGFLSIQQPTISPLAKNGGSELLWNNRAFEQSLIAIARAAGSKDFDVAMPQPAPVAGKPAPAPVPPRAMTWHEFLMNAWQSEVHAKGSFVAGFGDFWNETLRRGVLDFKPRIVRKAGARKLNVDAVNKAVAAGAGIEAKAAGLTLAVYTMPNVYDGRDANNPFLLELPDPVSKISWDNFVAMSPATAKAEKLKDGDILKVTANGVSVEAPVRSHPGIHEGVLAVGGGWGRTEAGAVGTNEGFNAFALGKVSDGAVYYSGAEVAWERTGRKTELADVQGHNYMKLDPKDPHEPERQIVQATSLEMFNTSEQAAQPYYHIPYWELGKEMPDQWKTKDFPDVRHKWVMTIDLNACNGCNACVIACQSENNVPVVGKREVLMGREMHWIRIDRYFKGDAENPEVAKQPMLCQHCDNAPCETVCPVLATVHNDEGINQQVYNRCVGTRYCANNCPYKVRRFNFYEFSKFRKGPHEEMRVPETPLALALNPDITVRSKGIMEKCTFCSQRIREAKDVAKAKGRDIREGELKTACQQTCPAQAIHFGDALNPDHGVNAVREENHDKRGYGVLAELNVRPNVMYLAQIWNRETKEHDVKYHEKHHHGAEHGDGHGDDHGKDAGHGGGTEHPSDHGDGKATEHHSGVLGPATGVKA